MNKNHLYSVLSMLIILFGLGACLFPGQPAQPQAAQPTPAINSDAVASAVAGTAQAAAQQTSAVQPIATGMVNITLEQGPDGTTLYTDYEAGFQIMFPAGWLAVSLQPDLEEFNAILAKEGAVNPMLAEQMELDRDQYNADLDRLHAYILRPDIRENSLFGVSDLLWSSDDSFSLDSVTMEQLVQNLESSKGPTGFHAETVQTRENSNHVKIIEVSGHYVKDNGEAGTVSAYATDILFKPTADTIVRIQFRFVDYYRAQLSIDVGSIIESIQTIEAQ